MLSESKRVLGLRALLGAVAFVALIPAGFADPAPEPGNNPPAPETRGQEGEREERPRREGGPGAISPEEQRRRMLMPYEQAIPDLSEAQKTQILAVLDAANAEFRALRDKGTLSRDELDAARERLRSGVPGQVKAILTEPQRATWLAYQEDLRQQQNGLESHIGALKGRESREEKRARLAAGYEEILDELSVRKKTDILAALATEDDAIQAAQADPKLTEAQKKDALKAAGDTALKTIEALLSMEQFTQWKKAREIRANKPAAPPKPPAEAPAPPPGPAGVNF